MRAHRDAHHHVYGVPPGERDHDRECHYTVCRPVQTTSYKTVSKTCYQTVTETACREVCEKVCVPRTIVKPVCRTYKEAVVQR